MIVASHVVKQGSLNHAIGRRLEPISRLGCLACSSVFTPGPYFGTTLPVHAIVRPRAPDPVSFLFLAESIGNAKPSRQSFGQPESSRLVNLVASVQIQPNAVQNTNSGSMIQDFHQPWILGVSPASKPALHHMHFW